MRLIFSGNSNQFDLYVSSYIFQYQGPFCDHRDELPFARTTCAIAWDKTIAKKNTLKTIQNSTSRENNATARQQ